MITDKNRRQLRRILKFHRVSVIRLGDTRRQMVIGQRTDGNRLCILSGERERDHKSIPVSARGHWLFPKRKYYP